MSGTTASESQDIEFWHHHLGVSVADLDGAIGWYSRVLGFQLEQRFAIESIPAEIAMLVNGDMRVELLCVPGAAPASADRRMPNSDLMTHGNKHISFSCDDLHALVAVLRERDADIVWVKDFGEGRVNAFIRDAEGNLLEFVQQPRGGPSRATL